MKPNFLIQDPNSPPKKEIPNLIDIDRRLKKMEVTFDENPSLIIDNGTDSLKCGLSNTPVPKTYELPSNPHTAIIRGTIQSCDFLADYYESAIAEAYVKKPAKFNVVIVESPIKENQRRKELAELFFEEFGVDSIAFLNSAATGMFSSGKTKGLVINCGESLSWVIPVFEGYALKNAIQFDKIGGEDITNCLYNLVQENMPQTQQTEESKSISYSNIKKMKEKACELSKNYELSLSTEQLKPIIYALPDSENKITISPQLKYTPPEILFRPELFKIQSKPLPKIIADSLKLVPKLIKPQIVENMQIIGGSTLFKGFKERLGLELYKEMGIVGIQADPQRKFASWRGVSMLASFSTFSEYRISHSQYKEDPSIVFKKNL